ncbi:hypothetical protein P7C71_g4486, partial [Lecanoromycetidae sp. Uapishka_2]
MEQSYVRYLNDINNPILKEGYRNGKLDWVETRDPRWNDSILPWDEWAPQTGYTEVTMTVQRNGYGYGFEGVPIKLAATVLGIYVALQGKRTGADVSLLKGKRLERDGFRDYNSATRDIYDYIVVGGGQSGLTVANRLSEGKATVLVVEYGNLYLDDLLIARPWQPFDLSKGLFHDPKLMYNISSTPQAGLNDRRSEISAAASVGGGSTVNGMFLNRGAAEDYDAWEKLGNPGWGWKGMLPYFKKSVTFSPPGKLLQEEYGATYDTDAAYGENGPIQLSNPDWAWPGQKVQMAGWRELGIEQATEGAGGDAVGMFWVPRAQDPKKQTRSYAVTGHLDPALARENFDLLPGHRVTQILLSRSNRAEGVMIQRRGGNANSLIRARKEVVLAAGLHTPVIMQRSGIGPRKVLEKAGIDVRVELPGVGMNLQDHPAVGLAYGFKTDFPLNPGTINAAQAQDEFRRTRSGPHSGGHNVALFLPAASFLYNNSLLVQSMQTDDHIQFLPPIYEADTTLSSGYHKQLSILAEAYASNRSTIMGTPIAGDSFSLLILQKPLSRGTITLDPSNPIDGDPLVDYGTLINPLDVGVMTAMMQFTRKWYRTDAMKRLSPIEHAPGADVTSDEDLEMYIRDHAESTIGHQSGTTAMMPLELGGVVGPDLLVYGVQGLSVVDASMIPLVPSTNLCATVYAVAEKAADLIKKRNRT